MPVNQSGAFPVQISSKYTAYIEYNHDYLTDYDLEMIYNTLNNGPIKSVSKILSKPFADELKRRDRVRVLRICRNFIASGINLIVVFSCWVF